LIAARITVHAKGGSTLDLTLTGDVAMIRSHDAVLLVSQFGVGGAPPVATFVKVVRRAVLKVQARQY
jgi:hypothetical protein